MENKTLGEFADDYTSPSNYEGIECAGKVNVNCPMFEETKPRKDGTKYTVTTIDVNSKKYRVPSSVIVAVKNLRKSGVKFDEFSVIRTGTTKDDTKYQVVPYQKVA